MSLRFLLVVAGGGVLAWSVRSWRQAIRFALILLVAEGALRKWVFPGAQDLIYFAKDVFFLGAYAGFLRDRAAGRIRYHPPAMPVLYFALGMAAVIGVLEIFNPNLPNLLVGILGFKAYFLYVPLLFVVPAVFESDADFYRFLRRYVLIAIPVGVLAISQFFSPSTSVLNTYAWNTTDYQFIATFGTSTYVRVTGTFSFITGYTSYLLATAILILTVLGASGWRFRGNLLIFTTFGMTLLGMFMSGSRGPVAMLTLISPLYWWLAVAREGRAGVVFGRALLGLGLVAAFLAYFGGDAMGAFYGRATHSTDLQSRFSSPLQSPFLLLPDAGPLGLGIGATHQTAAAVTPGIPPYSWLHGLTAEVETGRIMVELGAVGFLAIYFTRLLLVAIALREALRLRTRFHRGLATASFLFLLIQVFGGAVFDVTAGVYYWLFAGMTFLAIRLDEKAVATAARKAGAAPAVPAATPAATPAAAPVPESGSWQPAQPASS
ncbi:MAG: hypothetical protein QOF89_3390 [Acidobacteriota bacterium]|jgi:hypothetical protein|nr:hypothetical protein [Acidobacteriota bacterium]